MLLLRRLDWNEKINIGYTAYDFRVWAWKSKKQPSPALPSPNCKRVQSPKRGEVDKHGSMNSEVDVIHMIEHDSVPVPVPVPDKTKLEKLMYI